jgi:hypothetical protein
MDEHTQSLLAFLVLEVVSNCSDITHKDAVDCLQMGWVGKNAQLDFFAIDLNFFACTQMIFDIPRVSPSSHFKSSLLLLELSKNLLEWLLKDIGQGVESTSMSHTEANVLDIVFGGCFLHE